ncbi:MAG: L,D-transpeptidase [Candidatus Daviesbacteria bacterium]|nr:MAG: L,D-transpeptidase [Candidatus Daviesbacteria bacterium]
MWPRLLPVLLILISLTYSVANFASLRRELAYKLGISGDPTTACCKVDDILKSDGSFNESANLAIFNSQQVDYPKTSLAYGSDFSDDLSQILGTTNSSGEEKWIEVSLSEQHLWAREGNKVVIDFPISSGKWAPTPKGTFNIWYKTRYQSMIGGNKDLGTYYNLPNVPNNMFFYQGYAIHGAYWHNNFGQPMSHGCVNSPLSSVAALFEWAGPNVPPNQNTVRATAENPGTRVWVH